MLHLQYRAQLQPYHPCKYRPSPTTTAISLPFPFSRILPLLFAFGSILWGIHPTLVLRPKQQAKPSNQPSGTMKKAFNSFLLLFRMLACLILARATFATVSDDPSYQADFSVSLAKLAELELPEVYDVSLKIRTGMVTWDNLESKTIFTTGYKPQKYHQVISTKIINVTNHIGTHIDKPGHVDETLLEAQYNEDIDLKTLNGPALVVQVPQGKNLTAAVLESMNIPKGIKRVLFRTDNSDGDLWNKNVFFRNYTGFKPDGAKWLVENTDIKLVGVDYLSAATYDEVYTVHKELLIPQEKIVPLEGLDLRKISPGWYMIYCLPLNLEGVEGAPTRCILTPLKSEQLK